MGNKELPALFPNKIWIDPDGNWDRESFGYAFVEEYTRKDLTYPKKEVDALELEELRDAIANTPEDSFGRVLDNRERQGWFIRDEIVDRLSKAISALQGDKE